MAISRKCLSLVLAFVLAVALVPLVPLGYDRAFAEEEQLASSAWAKDIPALIAGGSYVEGEVLVAMVNQDSPAVGLRSASANLLDSAEGLMGASTATYEEGTGEAVPAQLRNKTRSASDGQGEDEVLVKLVKQDMSTEALLYLLAEDPRVLVAEPNYTLELSDPLATDLQKQPELPAQGAQDAQDAQGEQDAKGEATTEALPAPEAEDPRVGADEVAAAVVTPATTVDASALPQAASKSFVPTKEPEDVTGKLTQDLSAYQWGFSNVAGGLPVHPNRTPGFDIGLADWNKDKAALNSNPDQVVAVIDMGLDYNHPDLKNVMKDLSKDPHAAEYAKLGFGPFGANLIATSPDSATSKTDPMDEQYHGTHVAGIVAAEWNDVGTSGIANGTKLIGMKIGGQRSLSIDAAINAYEMLAQAMDVGLNLVATNNSWGAPSSSAKILSIAVAKLGERGAVSVFASGNNTANTSISPFTVNGLMHNPYVVSVNASMFAGKRAALSNYGVESTDVYAPGDSIFSTVPLKPATDRYSFLPQPGDAVRESFNTPGSEKARCYGSDTFNNLQNPVGSHSADFSSDAGGSWTVNRSMMKEGEDDNFKLVFKMEVDAAKLVDARMVGLDISVSTPSGSGFSLFAVPFMEAANGETISDQTQMQMVTYGDNWGRFTFDLKKLLEAGNAEGLKYYEEGGKTYVNIGLSLDPNGASVPAFDAHLDNISMGYESIGYYTTSGTSMASPVVAGAAAIFADRLNLDNSDRAQAAQNARLLAATLKGSVKTSDEFVGYCTSGGQISLDPTVKKTPVINEASVENAEGSDLIALSGYFFGADAGAGGAVLVGGKSAEVVSWSDNVVKVRCPKQINKGIHEVRVTNADNKTGRKTFNLALSTESPDAVPMLEETIVLPEKLASVARSAKMIGLGGKLYLMPDDAATSMGDSLKPYYGDLWRYDPQSKQWAELAKLPERLDTLSMTLCEGKLLVLGRTSLDNRETRLFSFDPATDAWSKLDGIQAIPNGAALTNVEGSLMLVGGSTEQGDIALFDLASRTVTPVGSLKTGRLLGNPLASSDISIAVSGSDLFVAGGGRPRGGSIGTKLERLSRTEQGYTASDIGGSLPKLAPEYPSAVGLAAPKAGIVAAGVKAAADGSPSSLAQTDLYLLDSAKPDSSFTSMGKRSSYGALEMPCALAYDGKLYVAGTDKHADPTFVLRATSMETVPQPGDVVAPAKPDPVPPLGEGAAKKLVSTGDPLFLVVGILLALSLAGVGVACVAGRRMRLK